MLNGIARVRLNQTSDDHPALLAPQYIISVGLAYWLLPVTIPSIWIKYLPRQDFIITPVHCGLVALATGSAIFLNRLSKKILNLHTRASKSASASVLSLLVFAGALGISVVALFVTVPFSPGNINFREAEVSTRPTNWDTQQDKLNEALSHPSNLEDMNLSLSPVKGAILSGLNLSYMRAFGSFLVNSDLSKSDLSRSDLYKADLRGAVFEGAKLKKAWLFRARLELSDLQKSDLSGSDLRYANLRKALLFQTNLQQADLTGHIWNIQPSPRTQLRLVLGEPT
jgi:uncharacterized protein YjbI with pentapeptide repeats